MEGGKTFFSYSVQGICAGQAANAVMAAVVDDSDQSSVQRGENAGRSLEHVFVVRRLGASRECFWRWGEDGELTLFRGDSEEWSQAHHLVLFLQESGLGSVEAVDAKAF